MIDVICVHKGINQHSPVPPFMDTSLLCMMQVQIEAVCHMDVIAKSRMYWTED